MPRPDKDMLIQSMLSEAAAAELNRNHLASAERDNRSLAAKLDAAEREIAELRAALSSPPVADQGVREAPAEPQACGCGANNPKSARYGRKHLRWCLIGGPPVPALAPADKEQE